MHGPAIEIEYSTGKIYYSRENGIYSSTDNGKTWTILTTTYCQSISIVDNDVTFIAASRDGVLFGDWSEGMFSCDTSLSDPVKLAGGTSDAAHDGKGFMMVKR